MKVVLICYIVQLFLNYIETRPSASDYDAYGIRFTANDFLIVEAQNSDTNVSVFAIQFYNLCPLLFCAVELNDSSMYVYSVSIGMNQTIQQQYFAFNGYMNDPNTNSSVAFIGMAQNQILNTCNFTLTYTILTGSEYDLGNYYVITVDPQGLMAYGFAFHFIVLYNLHTQQKVDWDPGFHILNNYNANNSILIQRFMPHAVAATNTYVILVGVIDNYNIGRWVPTAYLIDVRNCSVSVNSTCMPSWSQWPQWTYNLILYSWEMYTANDDYEDYADYNDAYQPVYYLSTDINPNTNKVLFGIQYFDTVIRLSVDVVNFSRLVYVDQLTSNNNFGFGKSVKYANDGSIVILANNFSYDYQTWHSSSIQIYNSNQNLFAANVIPVYTFPNSKQPLWTPPLQAEFLAIHMTSVALMFIDVSGNVYVLLFSAPGYGTDSSYGTGSSYDTNSSFSTVKYQIYFSNTLPCEPGTYSSDTSIYWCHLCPQGTFTSYNTTTKCAPCSNATSFCPLGSVSDTALSFISRVTQIRTYPESPENTIFDDILILNMFSLNTSDRRCLLISPLFWSLVIFGVAILIVILMGLLKLSIKCKSVRHTLKRIFRRTDLIGEGEFWIGGLASFSILILCTFAYSFSNSYLYQYPIETAGNSSFACDRSLRNAKFSSSLQLLATADTSSSEQQELFNLMNQQMFTLHVLFINTLSQCDELQVLQTAAFLTSSRPFQCSFDSNNSVMSVDTNLTTQLVTIQFIISNNAMVGGLSIGLTGARLSSDNNYIIVQELDFQEPFNVSNQTLTQIPTIEMQLVKVINSTKSLQSSTDNEQYSGLYIPLFVYDSNQVFYDENNFDIYHTSTQTTLTIQITNSLYYVQNIQEPITRESEIIFHNLLFTIVCIEIFGLVFLIFKLLLLPLLRFFLDKLQKKANRIGIVDDGIEEDESEMKKRIYAYLKRLEEKDENNRSKSNIMSSSIAVVPSEIDPSQHRLSKVEQSTNAV